MHLCVSAAAVVVPLTAVVCAPLLCKNKDQDKKRGDKVHLERSALQKLNTHLISNRLRRQTYFHTS